MNLFLKIFLSIIVLIGFTAAAQAQQSAAPTAPPPPKDWWVDIRNDHVGAIERGLKAGVDPNARMPDGQPALMYAVTQDAWLSFDALLADPRTDVNISNPAGETPLMYVSLVGDAARAEKLIARGAQVNILGWGPLHYAVVKDHLDVAKLLLAHGAMPNAPAPDGSTPLMMTSYSGSHDMAQLLLHAGAAVGAVDANGETAADRARKRGSTSLAEELDDLLAKQRSAQRSHPESGGEEADDIPTDKPDAAPAPDTPPQDGASDEASKHSVQGVQGLRLGY